MKDTKKEEIKTKGKGGKKTMKSCQISSTGSLVFTNIPFDKLNNDD